MHIMARMRYDHVAWHQIEGLARVRVRYQYSFWNRGPETIDQYTACLALQPARMASLMKSVQSDMSHVLLVTASETAYEQSLRLYLMFYSCVNLPKLEVSSPRRLEVSVSAAKDAKPHDHKSRHRSRLTLIHYVMQALRFAPVDDCLTGDSFVTASEAPHEPYVTFRP